jgi:hypothetical protein
MTAQSADRDVNGPVRRKSGGGRSPESVLLTPEVLECLRDGGFFEPRKDSTR